MTKLAVAIIALAADSHAGVVRIALFAGQNVGGDGDDVLRYAEADANNVFELFTTLGDVRRDRASIVQGATSASLRKALLEIRGRALEIESRGDEVVLLVYISSHAGADGLRLAGTHLRYDELRMLVRDVPGRMRVLIMDACMSGRLIREKGGRVVEPYSLDLERSGGITGTVVLTSAGRGEVAQEWESLGGSLFTHHLLSGLRGAGDYDGDGRVTLFEVYSYSYERTVSQAVQGVPVSQHPSHEIDIRGAGDLVLTRPAGSNSGMVFASSLAGHYVVSKMFGGELVAELDKGAGRQVRLALEPGRYVVRKSEGRFVRVGEVLVSSGTLTNFREDAMESVPYAQVSGRGGHHVRPWGLELVFGVSTGVVSGQGLTQNVGVSLRRETGPWEVAAALDLGFGRFASDELEVSQREVWGRALARLRWPIGLPLLYMGAGASVGWINQSLIRNTEQLIKETVGGGPMPDRNGLGAKGQAALGLELPVTQRVYVRIEGQGGVAAARTESGWEWRPVAGVLAAAGWRY